MDISQMKEKLQTMLNPCRYTHSIGVMETAVHYAELFGADVEQARVAGLLHDCAKDIPWDEMPGMCDRLGVPLDAETRGQPALIHADLGAKLCALEFGVTDSAIADAIRYHTLGRAGMTLLEKIIYLADCTEPNRKSRPGLAKLRALCEEDLDAAMLEAILGTIRHVQERGKPLHSQTAEALRYFESLAGSPCQQ